MEPGLGYQEALKLEAVPRTDALRTMEGSALYRKGSEVERSALHGEVFHFGLSGLVVVTRSRTMVFEDGRAVLKSAVRQFEHGPRDLREGAYDVADFSKLSVELIHSRLPKTEGMSSQQVACWFRQQLAEGARCRPSDLILVVALWAQASGVGIVLREVGGMSEPVFEVRGRTCRFVSIVLKELRNSGGEQIFDLVAVSLYRATGMRLPIPIPADDGGGRSGTNDRT